MGEELSQRIEEGKWSPLEKKLIEFVVTLIMFIVAYTNSPRFKDLVDKIFIKLKETYEVKDEKYLLSISSNLTSLAILT